MISHACKIIYLNFGHKISKFGFNFLKNGLIVPGYDFKVSNFGYKLLKFSV
jgi:hypothetical protein